MWLRWGRRNPSTMVRKERAFGCDSRTKEVQKKLLQEPCLVPALTHPTRPLQSGVGFAFFATLREIWMCAHRASRVFEAQSPHCPASPGLRYACPGLEKGRLFEAIAAHSRVWPLRRAVVFSYCQQPCWQLPAWLSANVDNLANKGQQPQIADRLTPHIGWEKGCRWSLACLTATGWRFSARQGEKDGGLLGGDRVIC